MQQAIDLQLNAFAMQLIAESFADAPEKFGDENVVFLSRAHGGQQVWFVMTKTMPTKADFDPPVDKAPGSASSVQIREGSEASNQSSQAHQGKSDADPS
jgi:hypothetical protein